MNTCPSAPNPGAEEWVPGLRHLASRWAVVGVAAGFSPGLILILFYALVAWRGIYWLCKARCADASSADLDQRVAGTSALFLILNVFIGSLLAGLVISQLHNIIMDPSAVLRLISRGVPRTASFFLTYLLALSAAQGIEVSLYFIFGTLMW